MKRRSAELLQKIPEIQIHSAQIDGSDSEDEKLVFSATQDSTLSSRVSFLENPAIPPIRKTPQDNTATINDDMMDIDDRAEIPRDQMDIDEKLTPVLQQMQEDPTYDSCFLTRKWKQVTTHERCAKLVI